MTDNFQISTLNMLATSQAFSVTEGLAYDAPYLYIAPHNYFLIAKIDTRSFKIVDTLDLSKVSPTLTGMLGCFVVDGFLYVLPHLSNTGPVYQSDVVKVDLSNFTPSGCTTLQAFAATASLNALNGLTDGTYGYLNMHVSAQLMITRFGLGDDFNTASLTTVAIPTIAGFPVVQANLVAVDKSAIYCLVKLNTDPSAPPKAQPSDMWLATIPTSNFTASAAKFQRLTNIKFCRCTMPIVVDDGQNLWVPPMPITGGPLQGKFIGVMKIPKANPAAVTISQGPASQPYPTAAWNVGTPFYDGWRYGYLPSNTAAQILQIDTKNPGTVNLIDVTSASDGYPMYGMGYDGQWGYAVSYNGGAGQCMRFLPTQPTSVSATDTSASCACCDEA